MPKKLFKVDVARTITMVVYAEDEADAEYEAIHSADDEVNNQFGIDWEAVSLPRPINHADSVPRGWSSSIPYGDDVDDRTVIELLAQAEGA